MISDKSLRQLFRARLFSDVDITEDRVLRENTTKDMSSFDWYIIEQKGVNRERRSATNTAEQTGFFNYLVNTTIEDEVDLNEEITDKLKELFKPTTSFCDEINDVDVFIDTCRVYKPNLIDELFYSNIVEVKYRAYSSV